MVNVLRHAPASPVVDEQAMHTFRHQWQAYSKLVDNDYLSHQAVRAVLHRELAAEGNRPFRFLDLACGDARLTVAALQGTPVSHYHGIDLSAPALELASQTVEALPCPVELEQGDFVAAMRAPLHREESNPAVGARIRSVTSRPILLRRSVLHARRAVFCYLTQMGRPVAAPGREVRLTDSKREGGPA